jgi:hypothetical protein
LNGSISTVLIYVKREDLKIKMSKYKLIQLTNNTIGALDANALFPLGTVTRRINAPMNCAQPFQVTSSVNDTLYINEPGYYKVTFSATLTAGAAGLMSISMLANNNVVYTVAEDVTAAEDIVNLTLPYVIRISPNTCAAPNNYPVALQFKLGDVATGITPTPSSANLIVEEVF